ncbi:MAG: hypothetical protein OXH75_26665 [Acidobacteria bacterium]|nr:hypothetical protein [Acidobacteriota bacterium]
MASTSATRQGSTVSAGDSTTRPSRPKVRAKGRHVFERLSASGWVSTEPEYARSREYLECLAHVP